MTLVKKDPKMNKEDEKDHDRSTIQGYSSKKTILIFACQITWHPYILLCYINLNLGERTSFLHVKSLDMFSRFIHFNFIIFISNSHSIVYVCC